MMKRSITNTGYAGMQNAILYNDNADVILGDAKETCGSLKEALHHT